jgi:hypothetical protein
MSPQAFDRDDLRALVRAALREALPDGSARDPAPAPTERVPLTGPPQDAPAPLAAAPSPPYDAPTARRAADDDVVDLRTDSDLDAFVRRVLALADNPKHRGDLLTGRRRFRLASGTAAPSAAPVHRVDRGAVTEMQVRQAAATGTRLVLGRRAVMTPLARDRARSLGVAVEKER